MGITRRVFLASGSAAIALMAGCGGRSQQNVTGTRSLNLYSARHYGSDTAIYESFTQKTGIKVNLIEAPADKLIERLKSEGSSSPADVILTVDAGNLFQTQQQGLLQPIQSSKLEQAIPDNLRDTEGHWFGFTKRARVVMFNKDKVQPGDLANYEDLADSQWKGRIVIRSSGNVYNQSLVGAMLAANGAEKTTDWAKAVVSNFARSPEGNDTAQIKAIASGLADLAIANTYYLVRLAKSENPEDRAIAAKIGVIFPNQANRGTHINISGGGVAKNAPNREAAIQFLEHLADQRSQEIFAKSNNEYPVVAGVPLDSVLASYPSDFKQDALNAKVFAQKNQDALKIMDQAGWK